MKNFSEAPNDTQARDASRECVKSGEVQSERPFASPAPASSAQTTAGEPLPVGPHQSAEPISKTPTGAPGFRVRAGQREFIRGVQTRRIAGLLARRQYGKTTIAAQIALMKMMRQAGHTVIFGSVKLDLGREIVRKEAEAIQKALQNLDRENSSHLVKLADSASHKEVGDLKPDDFAELYEAQRLEFRLYHSNSVYSRTKVVALTPAAVGETGDLILDEVGRVKNFREVWEAVKPIIASQPQFRCILTTTPPPDDAHYSFELLAPAIGVDFQPSPTGNWYRSELGVNVLRIDAWDAFADGVPLYDDETGAPISPAEARAKDHDKEAWDRNYGVRFVLGGTAAVGLLALDTAQRRGIGRCACFVCQDDLDFDRALAHITDKLGANDVGLGWDIATTEKESSNPSSLTVMEREGADFVGVATIVWKTRDPDIAIERMRRVIQTVNARPKGGRARRLAIDATSEKYFAERCRKEFGALVPVELVVASETVEMPGGEKLTKKTLLGSRWVAAIDDNHAVLPPERYLREDFRRVRKDKGNFVCEIGPGGEHGDTFDSHKLAQHALVSTGDGAFTSATAKQVIWQGQNQPATFNRDIMERATI